MAFASPATLIARLLVAWLLVCGAGAASAQSLPRENIDYTIVRPPQPTEAPAGKVEVIEFFGYWCPACNVFEPTLHDWVARNDGKIRMIYVPMPTHFRTGDAALQKLYYTLDAMGMERQLRPQIFAAIHTQRSLADTAGIDALADWSAAHGVDRKKFVELYNSFAIQSRVSRANQLATAYGLTGTPSLGIGGKYLLSVDSRRIGNADALLARALSGQ